MKQSSSKVTYPGRKQIFRRFEGNIIIADRLGLVTENSTESSMGEQPLLQLVFKQGKRVQPPETLEEIRSRTTASVASLPAATRQLDNPTPPPVEISHALRRLIQQTQR